MPKRAARQYTPVNAANLQHIKQLFHNLHKQLFTYDEPDSLVEVVNIESTVYGKSALMPPPRMQPGGQALQAIRTRRQMIFSAEGSAILTPVYDGERLGAGDIVTGPAVIEEPTTTVVISPGWTARLDESGTYVVTRNAL